MHESNAALRVSIVVPCYNSGSVVAEAVASALAQTYAHLDVVIVDDGSTDAETLRTLDTLAENDRTTVVRQENQGLSAARNAGIRASSADLILPLDADDLIEPVYVEEAVAILAKSPEVRLVYCRADLFGSETGPWPLPDFSWSVILVHNLIFASCVYRREDWETVGGYDSAFAHGREDHDFILKLLGLGGLPLRLDGTYFHYRRSAETMNTVFGQSREYLIDASARLLRNNTQLYADHADDLFRSIFGMQDEINDLRNRYRTFEKMRERFPWALRMAQASRRFVSRFRRP